MRRLCPNLFCILFRQEHLRDVGGERAGRVWHGTARELHSLSGGPANGDRTVVADGESVKALHCGKLAVRSTLPRGRSNWRADPSGLVEAKLLRASLHLVVQLVPRSHVRPAGLPAALAPAQLEHGASLLFVELMVSAPVDQFGHRRGFLSGLLRRGRGLISVGNRSIHTEAGFLWQFWILFGFLRSLSIARNFSHALFLERVSYKGYSLRVCRRKLVERHRSGRGT
mmetsp:Transcript_17722/g.37955  ORF Transcript_17722/g.37955 Transcript_17722/m.37955 type:complete len:227 (-) Transcript_17722:164-844(-)